MLKLLHEAICSKSKYKLLYDCIYRGIYVHISKRKVLIAVHYIYTLAYQKLENINSIFKSHRKVH